MTAEQQTQFYPDVKKHISPSALATWHNQRSQFIKTYFKGEKLPETKAMQAGTNIHALIEMGIITPVNEFAFQEKELVFPTTEDSSISVLGKPDAYDGGDGSTIRFVDYKTGKQNNWTSDVIATDLKMKTTAWLVLQEVRKGFQEYEGTVEVEPQKIEAHIEYIPTQWNPDTWEIEPTGEEHEDVVYTFDVETIDNFLEVIIDTIYAVNEEYLKYLESADFVDREDMAEYADLESQKKEIENKQKEIKERLQTQMDLGGVGTVSDGAMGTFYIMERKQYDYPDDLKITTEDGKVYTKAQIEELEKAKKVAEKQYEQEHEPKAVSRSLGFRLPKKK